MFVILCNETLATKIKSIHVYSGGYKIKEINTSEIRVENYDQESYMPVELTDDEISDRWVILRHSAGYSTFNINFFDETPIRLSEPKQTKESIKD